MALSGAYTAVYTLIVLFGSNKTNPISNNSIFKSANDLGGGSLLLSRSSPKVNVVYSALRPILHNQLFD